MNQSNRIHFVCVLAAALVGVAHSMNPPSAFAENVVVSALPGLEYEVSIAVNPINPSNPKFLVAERLSGK